MKIITKETVASIFLISLLVAGAAHAKTKQIPLTGIVGLSSVTVSARVEDGVAVVHGQVDSIAEEALLINYVGNIEGVDVVLDQVTTK